MRLAVAALLALVVATSSARADDVGVVVIGNAPIQPDVKAHLASWLKSHGHKIADEPLSEDAINTIANCLILDDQRCARSAVEARSSASSVVLARVEVPTKNSKDVAFTTYWFVKGHEAMGERRVCEHCKTDAWHAILDTMMTVLATGQVELGALKVTSDPPGMIVLLDNNQIGVTPLETRVPVGKHRVDVTSGGRAMGTRRVMVNTRRAASVEVTASVDQGSSRVGPALLLVAGVGALGTGAYFLYLGSLGGPNEKYVFTGATPIGVGVMAVGIGATIGGAVLLGQSGRKSTPVVAVTPSSGYVGWLTRF
jgi:hypothetical protein